VSGALPARPRTVDELARAVQAMFGLSVASAALDAGSDAPLDYLAHAFFADHAPGAIGRSAGESIDCVVWANRGGGKTFLGALATLLDLVYKPGIEVRILGGSLEQAQRMHQHLRAMAGAEAIAPLVEGRITDRRLRLANGSGVELLAQSQASVRGTRVQKLRCDEVELFAPAVWEAAQLVTRSREIEQPDGRRPMVVRGCVEAMSTMHLPYGLMRDIVDGARDGKRRLLRWGVVDVLGTCGDEHACRPEGGEPCALWEECRGRAKARDAAGLTPGHLRIDDALRLKARVGVRTWDAEMRCLRPRADDLVLPEFDPDTHVRALPPEAADPEAGWAWALGMDFGYRAPTVVLWAAISPEDVVHVADERVATRCLLGEHVDAILGAAWPAPAWVGIDPAGRQGNAQTGLSDAQQLARAGLVVRARRSAVRYGLDLLRARLAPASGAPRLLVDPRCRRLIESLGRYHYDPGRPMSEEPAKDGPDHAVDALRYLVINLERPGVRAGSYLTR